jgi:DNA-binding MarR family transcriptional regulator
MYDRYLTGSGLTSGQYSILAEIRRRGKASPTVSELAEALVMDRTALTHTLKPLERDGLIALKVDPADRRARLVHVTGLGEKRFAVAFGKWSKAQEQFTQSFGKKQAVALRALLRLVGELELGEMN